MALHCPVTSKVPNLGHLRLYFYYSNQIALLFSLEWVMFISSSKFSPRLVSLSGVIPPTQAFLIYLNPVVSIFWISIAPHVLLIFATCLICIYMYPYTHITYIHMHIHIYTYTRKFNIHVLILSSFFIFDDWKLVLVFLVSVIHSKCLMTILKLKYLK